MTDMDRAGAIEAAARALVDCWDANDPAYRHVPEGPSLGDCIAVLRAALAHPPAPVGGEGREESPAPSEDALRDRQRAWARGEYAGVYLACFVIGEALDGKRADPAHPHSNAVLQRMVERIEALRPATPAERAAAGVREEAASERGREVTLVAGQDMEKGDPVFVGTDGRVYTDQCWTCGAPRGEAHGKDALGVPCGTCGDEKIVGEKRPTPDAGGVGEKAIRADERERCAKWLDAEAARLKEELELALSPDTIEEWGCRINAMEDAARAIRSLGAVFSLAGNASVPRDDPRRGESGEAGKAQGRAIPPASS